MAAKPRRFVFTTALVKRQDRRVYIFDVPEHVSQAVGRRGPIPAIATYGKEVEVHQRLVPMGGGRHWLQLSPGSICRSARVRGFNPVHM